VILAGVGQGDVQSDRSEERFLFYLTRSGRTRRLVGAK
jgi:hypothetical protein